MKCDVCLKEVPKKRIKDKETTCSKKCEDKMIERLSGTNFLDEDDQDARFEADNYRACNTGHVAKVIDEDDYNYYFNDDEPEIVDDRNKETYNEE